MGNSVFAYACEIENICDELKALLSNNGAFDAYGRKLLERLQKLSFEIETREEKRARGGIAFLEYKKRQEKRIRERKQERQDGMKEALEKAVNEWRTTDDGHRIHFGENGEPDKGNPYIVGLIQSAIDKDKGREEAKKNTRGSARWCAKTG